jgi:hypothetical protein
MCSEHEPIDTSNEKNDSRCERASCVFWQPAAIELPMICDEKEPLEPSTLMQYNLPQQLAASIRKLLLSNYSTEHDWLANIIAKCLNAMAASTLICSRQNRGRRLQICHVLTTGFALLCQRIQT